MFAQSSLIHFYYLKFNNAGTIINRPCVILFRLNALHLRPRRINLFTVYRFICANTNIIFFLCLKLLTLFLVVFLLLSYTQKKKQVFFLTSFHFTNTILTIKQYYVKFFLFLLKGFNNIIYKKGYLSICHNNHKTSTHIRMEISSYIHPKLFLRFHIVGNIGLIYYFYILQSHP